MLWAAEAHQRLPLEAAAGLWGVPGRKAEFAEPLGAAVVLVVFMPRSSPLSTRPTWGKQSAPKGQDAPRKDTESGIQHITETLFFPKTLSPEKQEKRARK